VVPVGGELIGSSDSIDRIRGVGINSEGSCSSGVRGRSREIISEGDEIEAGCMNGGADGRGGIVESGGGELEYCFTISQQLRLPAQLPCPLCQWQVHRRWRGC
jgi:hypothetical protein